MFDNIMKFFKKTKRIEDSTLKENENSSSKDKAKERLHLVLMQDRANVSADFLDLMRKEIIEVIKKYIDIDEKAIDVRLTNKENEDGTIGAPALYANIPILNIKDETRRIGNMKELKHKEYSEKENTKEEKIHKNNLESEEKKELEDVSKKTKAEVKKSNSKLDENTIKEKIKTENPPKNDVKEEKVEEIKEVKEKVEKEPKKEKVRVKKAE